MNKKLIWRILITCLFLAFYCLCPLMGKAFFAGIMIALAGAYVTDLLFD